jgi:putative hemin transport protein
MLASPTPAQVPLHAPVASDPLALRARWKALESGRKLRNREAAALLGVSEAELIGSLVGDTATRLDGDFRALLARLTPVRRTMALTRNEACVHERSGRYEDVSHTGHVGLVLGPDIDLRIFWSHWKHGFALAEPGEHGRVARSLQFYDATGTAVHKVWLRDDDSELEWDALVQDFAAPDQLAPLPAMAAPEPRKTPAADDTIDAQGFRDAWAAMTDTHEFFGLLKNFGVARTQALRLADPQFAWPVALDAPRRLLEAVAGTGLAIMVFVGNPGCIQIHTGPVEKVVPMGPWINVMDPDFNLHLREDLVTQAWLVRKPTSDGIVTSLEIFDAHGDLIAQFFGARKPGIPEKDEWRRVCAQLFPAPAAIGVPA